MAYKGRKEYLADCVIAAVGCLTNEDYRILPFEDIIKGNGQWNDTCAGFISYVKGMKDPVQYATKENFKQFILQRTGRSVLTEVEVGSIDLIYSQIAVNKEQPILKDPDQLFKDLEQAHKRLNLKKSLDDLTNSDEFMENDAVTWSDKYCEELTYAVDDMLALYETDTEAGNLLFADEVEDYYHQKIQERMNGKTRSFHWKCIDDLIPEGPTQGHGGLVTGSTGMGKSALALNIADHLIDADVPVLMLPIEMGCENTVDRLISHRTKIPYNELMKLKPEDYAAVKDLIDEQLRRLKAHDKFAICTDADITLRKLETIIKKFQAHLLEDKYCVIIIDLLTMIREFYATDANMAQAIEKAINMLDILSKKLGFHYIGIVQLNRTVEQDKVLSVQSIEKLKPTRAAIKNSNALLERARWNLSIFRPRYFADLYLSEDEAMTVQDIAEISLMKANNASVGRTFLKYDGPTFTLSELPNVAELTAQAEARESENA